MTLDEFNEKFSGSLEIRLSKKSKPISSNMYNEVAAPDATIKSVKFCPHIWVEEDEDFREPTANELDEVVLQRSTIKICGRAGGVIEHTAPNKKHFAARDLIAAIEQTERLTRGNTKWFGGIDTHHIFFEGLVSLGEGGVYDIRWGS